MLKEEEIHHGFEKIKNLTFGQFPHSFSVNILCFSITKMICLLSFPLPVPLLFSLPPRSPLSDHRKVQMCPEFILRETEGQNFLVTICDKSIQLYGSRWGRNLREK